MTKPKRLVEVDLIVGFAITLVVLGHFADRSSQGIDWYVSLKIIIYKFHMPLFMFASGAIALHVTGKQKSVGDYLEYCKKKILRLCPPFLIFGITIVFLKWFIQGCLTDPIGLPQLYDEAFLLLFFFTSDSAAGFLWYLVVLLELLLVAPILLAIFGNSSTFVFLFFATLNCTRLFYEYSNFLMIDFFIQLSLFFSLGMVYSQHRKSILSFLEEETSRYWMIFLIVFALSFLIIEHVDDDVSKVIIGTLSIPAFLTISLSLKGEIIVKALGWLSEFSLSIYLMNSITIGGLRGGVSYFFDLSPEVFLLMTPVFLVAGIFVPVLAYRYFFSRIGLGRFVK